MPSRRTFVATTVAALIALSAPAAAQEPSDVEDLEQELGATEQELQDAEASFEQAVAAIVQAERDLAAIEARIAERAAALGVVERELSEAQAVYDDLQADAGTAATQAADAEQAAEQSREEAEAAAAELQAADQEVAAADLEVDAAEALEREAVGQLENRVVEAFKTGSTAPQLGYVQGLIRAEDWHEVAVTASMLSRVLDNDRNLVEDAERARDGADAARARSEAAAEVAAVAAEEAASALDVAGERVSEASEAEAIAVALAEDAEGELVAVEALRSERMGALDAVRAERASQQAIYRRLGQDAAAMDALTARLNDQIETLQTRLSAARTPSPAGAVGAWSGRLPAAGQQWAPAIDMAARDAGVDPRLFAALVWAESGFGPDVVSHAGAIGLAQLMPGTAASLGVDPWVPEENLDGGARYLALRIDQTGSVELGLAAYNAGIGAVNQYGGIPPFPETQLYVVRVLGYYQQLSD